MRSLGRLQFRRVMCVPTLIAEGLCGPLSHRLTPTKRKHFYLISATAVDVRVRAGTWATTALLLLSER